MYMYTLYIIHRLNLHPLVRLGGVKSIGDAAHDINRANSQRFIMLIVRSNMDDTIYMLQPDMHNFMFLNICQNTLN